MAKDFATTMRKLAERYEANKAQIKRLVADNCKIEEVIGGFATDLLKGSGGSVSSGIAQARGSGARLRGMTDRVFGVIKDHYAGGSEFSVKDIAKLIFPDEIEKVEYRAVSNACWRLVHMGKAVRISYGVYRRSSFDLNKRKGESS